MKNNMAAIVVGPMDVKLLPGLIITQSFKVRECFVIICHEENLIAATSSVCI